MGNEVFPEDARSERGLSRRKLIQRAAVVAAAAWTAPVIIDSLGSAAFAAVPSGCKPYWVKLYAFSETGGTTNLGKTADFCPATGSGEDCDEVTLPSPGFSFPLVPVVSNSNEPYCANGYANGPEGAMTACCGNGGDRIVNAAQVGSYLQVTLPTGCYFHSGTGGVLAGRYDKSVGNMWGPVCSATRFVKTCSGGAAAGNGRYSTSTGWVKSQVTFNGTTDCVETMWLTYVYVQFCCS